MSAAAKPARPSKRDVIVIDGDDSANGQPAAKSVKIEEEEPVPSSEVVELQQQVLKLEEMLQNSCRATRIAELRAEEAESRLDSKHGIKDGFHVEKNHADDLEKRCNNIVIENLSLMLIRELTRENESLKTALAVAEKDHQEKLAEVSSQLDGARRRANNVFLTKTELAREIEELKTEMAELKRSNGTKRGESVNVKNTVWARENEALKTELAELRRSSGTKGGESANSEQQDKVKHLTDQLEKQQRQMHEEKTRYRERVDELKKRLDKQDDRMDEERRRASEDRRRYRARILELEQKLGGKVDVLGQDLLRSSDNQARIDEPVHKLAPYELLAIDHPGNIFKRCRPNSSNSISYESAREKLLYLVMKLEGNTIDNKLNQSLHKFPELHTLFGSLECQLCKVTVNKTTLLTHFFGQRHRSNVHVHDVAVSRAALEYWMDKLKPDAQPKQQQLHQWPRDLCSNQLQLSTAAAAVPVAPQQIAGDAPDPQPVPAAVTKSTTLGGTVKSHEIVPSNIFQLCPLDWISSMSFENAREQLLSIVMYDEDALIERFMRQEEELMSLDCRACEMTLNQEAIITHFLSRGHQKKVTTLGVAVSRAAVLYWADKLHSKQSVEASGVVARPMQHPAASPAASPSAIRKEIKKEEIDD